MGRTKLQVLIVCVTFYLNMSYQSDVCAVQLSNQSMEGYCTKRIEDNR